VEWFRLEYRNLSCRGAGKVLPSNCFHVEHVLLMVFRIRDYALRELGVFVPGLYARKGSR
jgi:hypothetical protein